MNLGVNFRFDSPVSSRLLTSTMFRSRTTLEGSKSCQRLAERKIERTKEEELLHCWNLIHLIDSKWSNSDLARLGHFLSDGIKSFCPGENEGSRRLFKDSLRSVK